MIKRALAFVLTIAAVCVGLPLLGAAPSGVAGPAILGGRVHASFQPNEGKVFILVIGNDAREGNPDSGRADAVHLVGINTETMKGGIINFPRDSWVNIPGYGSGRINEALIAGGPLRLAQTVESLTGIRIDYWVMVGFEDFRDIIGEIGGVKMNIPTDVYDPTGSGAKLEAGVQTLGPLDALAYVRTRHSFPNGDIDRTTHQGDFLLAMLKKLRRQTSRNPGALLDWMGAAQRNSRTDLGAGEMFRLGVLATQVAPKDVGNVTVPVSLGNMGGASVVFIQPAASAIYQRLRDNGSL